MWGTSSTSSTDVWAGPPSWDPIVVDKADEGQDDRYAYGDIRYEDYGDDKNDQKNS